ncbi:response regulator [Thermodesulfobacteriota bacterium]
MKRAIRVILLDDNEEIRGALSELLLEKGFEVFSFSNPLICPLQKLPECRCSNNQNCTDIIISDLDMPYINGLSFIENQKEKNCKCRHVVLMSGKWTEEDLARAHELGCKTFQKPFPFDEFYEWLDKIGKKIDPEIELTDWFLEKESDLNIAGSRK